VRSDTNVILTDRFSKRKKKILCTGALQGAKKCGIVSRGVDGFVESLGSRAAESGGKDGEGKAQLHGD
jgi:hypothetical protein